VTLKETAMKVVEIEELRSKRLGLSDRDEAVRGLSLKIGDKKRRI
jgi:hypothetical protein